MKLTYLLNFDEKEVKNITRKLQTISVSGTVKIVKTVWDSQCKI